MIRSHSFNSILPRSLSPCLAARLRPVRALQTSPISLVAPTAARQTMSSENVGSPSRLALRDLINETQLLEDFDKKKVATVEASKSLIEKHDMFVESIAMVSGPNSIVAYNFVLALWRQVFFVNTNKKVKEQYLAYEDKIVNLMINNADYDSYKRLIKPLPKPEGKLPRAHFIMDTFQFQRDKTINRVFISENVPAFFSSAANSKLIRHEVLAFYLRKAILYHGPFSSTNEPIESFMEYSQLIEPFEQGFSTGSPNYEIYKKAFRLLLTNQKKSFVSHMQNVKRIMLLHVSKKLYGEFLSYFMELTAFEDPKKTVAMFELKGSLVDLNEKIQHTPGDLAHVMNAYMQLKDYNNVTKVYSENRKLHTEDHIKILLRLCAKTKDWKGLQSRFENMYGMGDLPRELHYTVVMSALVAAGAPREIKRLMKQLKTRNLKPNVYMYISLMRAALNANDVNSVKNSHSEFLQLATEDVVPKEDAAKLLPIIIELAAQLADRNAVIEQIEKLYKMHRSGDMPLINTDTLIVTMRLASALYSERLSETAFEFARCNNLLSDRFYHSFITFLTQMGHYEKAEQLALEAHLNSIVPFQNALIYSAQLKNYRIWAAATTDSRLTKRLSSEAKAIIDVTRHGPISQKDHMELMNECAKFELAKGDVSAANSFFKAIRKHSNLKEKHYLPFFKYYLKQNDRDSDAKILSLYEDMTSNRVEISARTYLYVVRALVDIDAANKKGFSNSVKIFYSMLKMYDLVPADLNSSGLDTSSGVTKELPFPQHIEEIATLKEGGAKKTGKKSWTAGSTKNDLSRKVRLASKIPMSELTKNAISLIQLVHYYVKKCLGNRAGSSTLALNVIDRLVKQMGDNVNVEIRRDFFQSLAHVHYVNGDLNCANKYIDRTLDDFQEIFSAINNAGDTPKLLSLRYNDALGLKYHILKKMEASPLEYQKVLGQVVEADVNLDRLQFDRLFLHIIEPNMSLESFEIVLGSCERFLVSGNMADVKLSRLIRNVFCHFMIYRAQSLSQLDVKTKFGLLCDFYGFKLRNEKKQVKRNLSALRRNVQVEIEKLPPSFRISLETLVSHPARLFVPGRPSWQSNYINASFASHLVKLLDKFCAHDTKLAFSLYEKYPETFEYLLIYREERFRFVAFQNDIRRLGGHFERSDREETHKYIVKVLNYVTTYGLSS